jgi:hypothetical protein
VEIPLLRIFKLKNTALLFGLKKLQGHILNSYKKAGSTNVENMKILAKSGSGLSAFITKNVKYLYD